MSYYQVSSIFFAADRIEIFCRMEEDKDCRVSLDRRHLKMEGSLGKSCFLFLEENGRRHRFGTEKFFSENSTIEEEEFYYLVPEFLLKLYQLYAFYYMNLRSFSDGKSTSLSKTIPTTFLKTLLESAVFLESSDIHLEIFEKNARIRLRIDGSLRLVLEMEREVYSSFVSQIKVFSNLDIVERRIPQDGSFSMAFGEQEIDFRISTSPSFYGEKVVIRILDRSQTKFNIETLGFSTEQLQKIKEILSRKNGLILNCGPTGSGKTTTLYSFLNYKEQEEINIISVEDPVEYHLHGITQIACREEIGLDYPLILKSLLRQDPDVIMIGEIRDRETAEIAVKAALTGHLVISTIHAKDSVQCIERLRNLGVDSFLIVSSLQMILSQRLVKKLCPFCKVKSFEKERVLNLLYDSKEVFDELYEAKGCIKCQNRGYKGRIPIFELLVCDEENKKWILSRSHSEIQPKMETLLENAFKKLKEGTISYKEVVENI